MTREVVSTVQPPRNYVRAAANHSYRVKVEPAVLSGATIFWCAENIHHEWSIDGDIRGAGAFFTFADATDAVFFKLRFA